MSFWKKLKFWKRREDRKTGVLKGILKCLVPCVRQHSSPDTSRSKREEINLEHSKETSHRCTGTQYKDLIKAERRQELLDIRQVIQSAQRRNLPNASPHSAQLEGNFQENTEQDRQGRMYIQDYQLIGLLGRGSFGQVILAKKRSPDGRCSNKELFALKAVPHSRIFKIEKEVHIRAVGHPFLIQLLSYFETQVGVYYVMEYMEGGTLHSLLRQMGQFPKSATRFYAAEIILAVSFLHKCGIVHRDIKPGNVLLNRDGHCKIADFGLSQVGIFDGKVMTDVCGTEKYMAPEIQCGHPYGCEVDWWSVGLVMYEMMLGLYNCPVFKHPARYPRYLTGHAESILRMFLERDPRRRLGARGDTRSILKHPFFKTVDWEAVLQKRVTPPIKPDIIEVVTGDPEAPGTADSSGRRVVLEPNAPVEPAALLEAESPVDPDALVVADALVEPGFPVETGAPVEPGALVEADALVEPAALLKAESPVDPDALVVADALVEPGSPVEPGAPVEAGAPVEPAALLEAESPVDPDALVSADALVEPGSPVETEVPVEPGAPVELEALAGVESLVEVGALVEPDASVESDSPMEIEAPMEPDTPLELDAIPEHVKREVSSLKEEAKHVRKLLKEKEPERNRPPFSMWRKIKYVAGRVLVGLMNLVL